MDYNKSTADIQTSLKVSTSSLIDTSFATIKDVSIDSIASQNQIVPRQIRTGNTRGDQRVKGNITIADNNNVTKVVMGYVKGGF